MNNSLLPYRAWLKKEKRMVEVQSINFHYCSIIYNSKPDKDHTSFQTWTEGDEAPFANIILMQSAGWPDKSGMEIYGQDIVDTGFGRYVVYRHHTGAWGFNLSKTGVHNFRSIASTYAILKVIGNDLENPELMEETQ